MTRSRAARGGRLPLASLARAPLPRVRITLARRQRAMVGARLATLERLVHAAIAGPLADVPAGRAIAAAFAAFRRGLATHVRAEGRVLRVRGGAPRSLRQRDLERRIRDHQHCEERIDALRAVVEQACDDARAPAVVCRLHRAVHRMETALHEQIYAENHLLFRRLRGLR